MIDLKITARRNSAFSLDLSWRAASGDRVVGVHGPSGAGKTTLLHLIAGLLRPDAGRIEVGGTVLFDAAERIDLPVHRRRVAVVFQEHRLLPHLSVERNLRYAADGPESRFREIVDVLELGSLLDRVPSRLSGGESQRVALGRAMLSSPRLMLLDEPFASMDQSLRDQIMPFLRRLVDVAQIPVLCVSHDLPDLLRLTDRLLLLEAGRCVGSGAASALLQEPAARRLLRRHGFVSVVDGVVERGDPSPTILVGDTRLTVAAEGLVPGTRVRAIIKACDVALSLRPLEGVSIQNRWKARVARLARGEGGVFVELDAGFGLIAEVSEAAASDLALRDGSEVWCLVKARSIACGA
ncbi:MAG: molybdenum ABC transporter ATP-binding protein [Phycisphaerae bacterium]|jgi:molybdate transport system ATP-binding protein